MPVEGVEGPPPPGDLLPPPLHDPPFPPTALPSGPLCPGATLIARAIQPAVHPDQARVLRHLVLVVPLGPTGSTPHSCKQSPSSSGLWGPLPETGFRILLPSTPLPPPLLPLLPSPPPPHATRRAMSSQGRPRGVNQEFCWNGAQHQQRKVSASF